MRLSTESKRVMAFTTSALKPSATQRAKSENVKICFPSVLLSNISRLGVGNGLPISYPQCHLCFLAQAGNHEHCFTNTSGLHGPDSALKGLQLKLAKPSTPALTASGKCIRNTMPGGSRENSTHCNV